MSKNNKRKGGNQLDDFTKAILLTTALLQFINALIDFFKTITE